jgi:hypothetical protein
VVGRRTSKPGTEHIERNKQVGIERLMISIFRYVGRDRQFDEVQFRDYFSKTCPL